ncbi:MAG: DUF5696 domain-containing protein [Anaerocolumna sp.]
MRMRRYLAYPWNLHYLETLGTIKKKDTFLGFAYDKSIALTTFGEARQILSELKTAGMPPRCDSFTVLYCGSTANVFAVCNGCK